MARLDRNGVSGRAPVTGHSLERDERVSRYLGRRLTSFRGHAERTRRSDEDRCDARREKGHVRS